jgi:hypothetical protein
MPLFASLRARLPHVPVIVLTNSLDARVEHWFKTQDRCFFCRKVDLLPAELADMIRSVALFDADALVARLQNCKPGPDSAYEYQTLCIDILKYLFIPPMKDVHAQAARQDGHEVRDAVIHNECTSGFWWAVYNEFSARHIVVEFKNYTAAVRKSEVAQLRRYLGRKSLGRFGIILSRMPPSDSALTEQRDAYGENDIMILFLSDSDLVGMIRARANGGDPADVLRRHKNEFEVRY